MDTFPHKLATECSCKRTNHLEFAGVNMQLEKGVDGHFDSVHERHV